MKIQRVFVLRFNDGRRIPYGVPEFLSEDEAEDFLAHDRAGRRRQWTQQYERRDKAKGEQWVAHWSLRWRKRVNALRARQLS